MFNHYAIIYENGMFNPYAFIVLLWTSSNYIHSI